MSYGLNLGWGGPIGDYIEFWGGPIKGDTTNLVQGSYRVQGLEFRVWVHGSRMFWDNMSEGLSESPMAILMPV